jgi:hypothetical protein
LSLGWLTVLRKRSCGRVRFLEDLPQGLSVLDMEPLTARGVGLEESNRACSDIAWNRSWFWGLPSVWRLGPRAVYRTKMRTNLSRNIEWPVEVPGGGSRV